MKDQAFEHYQSLMGLIDGNESDELGSVLSPIAEYLRTIVEPPYYVYIYWRSVICDSYSEYLWGPFESQVEVETWLLEFYNRLCEEYQVIDKIVRTNDPLSLCDKVRAPSDFDGGGECLLYDEPIWHYESLKELNR